MKKYLVVLATSILCQSCTSINQPTASRPLVEEQFTQTINATTSSISQVLSQAERGDSIRLLGQDMFVSASYVSATGADCLKLSNKKMMLDVYCAINDNGWIKINRVLAEYNSLDSVYKGDVNPANDESPSRETSQ